MRIKRCNDPFKLLWNFYLIVLLVGCGGGGGGEAETPSTTDNTVIVLAVNDLGMHCMDREFSIFSILPPFNVLHAQVLRQDSTGKPVLMTDADYFVRYSAIADATGSINSRSIGKTDFWTYAGALFAGSSLNPGESLTGLYMPADHPTSAGAQPLSFDATRQLFAAFGIPITPGDDALSTNTYPLMRVGAYSKTSGNLVRYIDAVVPVASETDCQTCHKTGGIAATRSGITWASDTDLEVQAKKNILKLHNNSRPAQNLSAPVLCAGCHYSRALDLAGAGPSGNQTGKPEFSRVMHRYHGELTVGGNPVFPADGRVDQTCYMCHPGKITQCLRGAMKNGGMECNDCHGGMLAVGGVNSLLSGGSIDGTNDGGARRPWLDLPRCQSCHTGDAVSHAAGSNFRLRQTYIPSDSSASPRLAVNKRFAENTNQLYKLSKGHGGVICQGCHGSTHAEWPVADANANDNAAAIRLQGYPGKILECVVCHKAGSLPRTISGPHGLHNIGDARWYDDGHSSFYENNRDNCKACHGLNLTGTPLSTVPVNRSFIVESLTVKFAKGDQVSCGKCHEMPDL